ncbi:MAG: hypothetical protein V7637_1467 [Mycobacteriales bacterium]
MPTGRLRLRVSRGRSGRAALAIYRPLTARGRLVRLAASMAAALPVSPEPADPLIDQLAGLLGMTIDGACGMASSTAGRQILGLAREGRLVAVAKVGERADQGLRREARVLQQLHSIRDIRLPRLILTTDLDDLLVCVTEPLSGRSSRDPAAGLRAAVALGRAGWTHGDLTPWNLLREPVTVLDWETARHCLLPMYDLSHYVLQEEAHLGRGDPGTVLWRLCGPGGLGARYLAALGLPLSRAPALLRRYLDEYPLSAGPGRVLRQAVRERFG